MPNPKARDFVEQCRESGFTDSEIMQSLKEKGWPHEEIKSALGKSVSAEKDRNNDPLPQSDYSPEMNPFQKIISLLFSLGEFFGSVSSEQGYLRPLLFFVVTSLIAAFVGGIVWAVNFESISGALELVYTVDFLFGPVIWVGLAFTVPFIGAGMAHLGVLIFGGRRGYYNTFKPYTYSLIITNIYILLVYCIQTVFFSSMLGTMTTGIAIGSFPSFQKTIIASLGILIILTLVAIIHSLIVQVIGIARFQEMSKIRAFLAAIIIPLLIFIIIFVFVMAPLAYFEVLSPDSFLPEKCFGPPDLDCMDRASISSGGELVFVIRNSLGYSIAIGQNVVTDGRCRVDIITSVNDLTDFPVTIENSGLARIKLNCASINGKRFYSGIIIINYINAETGLSQQAVFDIKGSVT